MARIRPTNPPPALNTVFPLRKRSQPPSSDKITSYDNDKNEWTDGPLLTAMKSVSTVLHTSS